MSARRGTTRRFETEIKLPVRDSAKIRRRIRALGFRLVAARHLEQNYLFDFPDLRLRKARCVLRLRYAGRQGMLTFKGTPKRSTAYKVRREIETSVPDGPRLRQILESLGLREAFRYEKYRTVYAPRGRRKGTESLHLFYDQTPIGDYLELEGSASSIDRAARGLGFSRQDYISASYGTLYRQYCLERGRKPGNMLFPSRESW